MASEFVIARNPDEASSLPFLVRLPLGANGIALKVRETWPRTSKVYCHRADEWPDDLEVIERIPVRSCVQHCRSNFQAYRSWESTLTSGKLGYLLADLTALPRAALVVEDRWSAVFKLDRVRPSVVADGLAEAQVRFPTVPIVFCETRTLAQEWTYRFLGAAVNHRHEARHGDARTAALPMAGAVTPPEPTTADVRRWAREGGLDVSDRGRLRPEIWEAYRAAHGR